MTTRNDNIIYGSWKFQPTNPLSPDFNKYVSPSPIYVNLDGKLISEKDYNLLSESEQSQYELYDPSEPSEDENTLRENIWRLLPDDCKRIMAGLKDSFLDCVMAYVDAYVPTVSDK